MRRFRLWLSFKLFKLGKWVHPEISELTKKVIALQYETTGMQISIKNSESVAQGKNHVS